jgi:lysophospholipase L1-like esterase
VSSRDSWTIAPVIGWFVVALVAGLWCFDGGLQALAGRITTKRAPTVAPGGPVSAPGPSVAEADEVDVAPPVVTGGAGGTIGALEDTCVDGSTDSCKRWAMDGFYKAVVGARKNALGRAVRVSWYGDSVVADDQLASRLRKRLQEELGDGGPGFVYVVPPHRFCQHEGITRSADEEQWRAFAISTHQTGDGLYGPAGSTVETYGGKATIKLVDGKVTGAELYYLAQPKGGEVTVTGDGAALIQQATAAEAKTAAWASGHSDGGVKKLQIEARGNVRLFGIDLENAHGAVVDNLGIVSVHSKSFAVNDAAHWAAEVDHRGADLMMIMIGANEAEWLHPGDTAMKEYQGHYEALLAPLRRGRPDAACLVVSPTDQSEEKDGEYKSRPVMPRLVAAQRAAAHAQGCAFYSTYDWMGGKGSSAKWFRKRLVSSDFQHLSRDGANKMADAIFDVLMAGARRYAGH